VAVDPITGRVDFIPETCQAIAIANSLTARECKLASLSPPSIGGSAGMMGDALGSIGSISLSINDLNVCILAAVTQAFVRAGCTMPTVQPNLPTPDLDDCVSGLDRTVEEAADPLGHLSSAFDITFDENGIPTRIQT
jgi:hypothetical protein